VVLSAATPLRAALDLPAEFAAPKAASAPTDAKGK
jgi:hypothetical protein